MTAGKTANKKCWQFGTDEQVYVILLLVSSILKLCGSSAKRFVESLQKRSGKPKPWAVVVI
jgi:hypothetical protein